MYEKTAEFALRRTGFGTSLPASPSDGDEFILVDSTSAATYQWRLRYNANRTSNKWEFIGGSPQRIQVDTDETTSTTATWVELTTSVILTIPAAGDYIALGWGNAYVAAGPRDVALGVSKNNASPAYWTEDGNIGTVQQTMGTAGMKHSSLVAGDTLRHKYYLATAGTLHFLNRVLQVTPIALGG